MLISIDAKKVFDKRSICVHYINYRRTSVATCDKTIVHIISDGKELEALLLKSRGPRAVHSPRSCIIVLGELSRAIKQETQ